MKGKWKLGLAAVLAAGILCTGYAMVFAAEEATAQTEMKELLGAEDNIASGVVDEDYGQITWVIDSAGKLTVSGWGNAHAPADGRWSYMCPWYSHCKEIKSAEINVSGMTDASLLFLGCSNLKSLDLSNFDTSNVINMGGMFVLCSSLTSLDLSSFDTSNVTDMSRMFNLCTSLVSLDLSNFDTSNVTDMSDMFLRCDRLNSVDLSSFDTSNVTDMGEMFGHCGLRNLDLSNFDTGNVTDMTGMFDHSSLVKLDVGNFDTRNVTDMRAMFWDCTGLTSLDLSSFDTSNVTDMGVMFNLCTSLVSLDLSSFNTKKVTDMESMFGDCSSLTSLDLSNFDMRSVTDGEDMLSGCSSLKKIKTPLNCSGSVELPHPDTDDKWYRPDGSVITELPKELSKSITIAKNQIIDSVNLFGNGKTNGKTVPSDKSSIYIIDATTGKPISNASVFVGGSRFYANSEGIAYVSSIGVEKVIVSAENYHQKTTGKFLEHGKCVTVKLVPESDSKKIASVVINMRGEDIDVSDNVVYLTHKSLDKVSALEEEFTIKAEAMGEPKGYQLLQNGKILQESYNGHFSIAGKFIEDSGKTTYYTDDLSAGYKVYVKALYGDGSVVTQCLGIKVSETSSIEGDWGALSKGASIDFGSSSIEIPDNIPLLGGSKLDMGWESDLPVKISVDEAGKVRIAVNAKDFDTGEIGGWYQCKEDYNKLAKRAAELSNCAGKFGGTPEKFGAGLFSVKGNITGYGEGYLSDLDEGRLRIDVGMIVEIEGEKKFTNYYFVYAIPFYVTYGGGIGVEAQGNVKLVVQEGKLRIDGGEFEWEPSANAKLEGGVGADGILSVEAYGKLKFSYLQRFRNNYRRIKLNGNAKIKATAFCWSKVLAEVNGNWIIYDSNRRSVSNPALFGSADRPLTDFSGAEVISMDYLEKRDIKAKRMYSSVQAADSKVILDYAYENASPKLLKTGETLYLFYLDGVEGRLPQNQTALFYQTSSDGGVTWSKPLRVDNGANETADYEYDAVTDGNDVWVVWSDAGDIYGDEILSMDSSKAAQKIARETNLTLAHIDGATGAVSTQSFGTDKADLQPQIALDSNRNVYVSWITNDMSSSDELFSVDNRFGIAYAASVDDFDVHENILEDSYYPVTMDLGILDGHLCAAACVDVDGDLNTQDDREIFIWNFMEDNELMSLTDNDLTDSVPQFAQIAGETCLFWYQNGNIAYTSDGHNFSSVFGEESSEVIGQAFDVLEGDNERAAIVWTATSAEEELGVGVFCTDFDGNRWSSPYQLGELESEYTADLSGFLKDKEYRMAYLGSVYEGETLHSGIFMMTPNEWIDTSVSWSEDQDAVPGEAYPVTFYVTNIGNVTVSELSVTSEDGTVSDTISGLSIAPGTSAEVAYEGISLPEEMTEVYSLSLTVKAKDEAASEENIISLAVGQPDFNISASLDYCGGEDLASVSVKNEGLLTSDAVVTIYRDEEHKKKLYQAELEAVTAGESRAMVINLDELDSLAEAFYFVVADKSGREIYFSDNQSIVYTGKGTHHEKEATVPDKEMFSDVSESAFYYDAVKWALENEITGGITATQFGPSIACNRAHMVSFLWKAQGSPEPTITECPFTDVLPGAYYYDAVLWALENEITSGTTPTTFSPSGVLTRGQSVTFLYKFAGNPETDAELTFKDVKADAFYADAVRWAAAENVTSGTTPTTFSPTANCTRGQIVTLLYRFMGEEQE